MTTFLETLLNSFFKERRMAQVIFLDTYRLKREINYPGIPVTWFKNWMFHKAWMQNELKKEARRIHNKGVLERFFKSRNSPYTA